MNFKVVVVLALLMALTGRAFAAETENYLQIKGEATVIVKPDIAHCFLNVTGAGENYAASNKAANDKLSRLSDVLKTALKETPQLNILKTESKPKSKTFDEKEYFTEMAKAMKGEAPLAEGKDKKEMATTITVYFSLTKFTPESILKLMNTLSEQEIAFDKGSRFDFETTLDFNFTKSAIYFGVKNTDDHLSALAAAAFKKAEHTANILAQAFKKKVTGLLNVTGCGDLLEGSMSIPFKSNITGKDLGPLSGDPSKLMIKFSKDFGFKIQ